MDGWSSTYEQYTYNTSTTDSISDGTLTNMRMTSGGSVLISYDYLQRLSYRTLANRLREDYTYAAGVGTNATSTLVTGKKNTFLNVVESDFTYTYDGNGNILTESDSISGKNVTYTYDNQNQLLSAVHSDGRTESYTYDSVGNILSFNNGTTVHSYTYGNSSWRDLLTAVDGTTLTYDTSGNPTSYYNGSSYTMSWIEGRKLASVTTGGKTTTYQYNADGLRVRKNNSDGSYILYLVADGTIIGEKHYSSTGSVTKYMRYTFDENGSVCGYSTSTNGTSWSHYYFIRNLQGDVIQLFSNSSNSIVAEYTYDSWGNVLTATGTYAAENPFRYRGYYYDVESGFYYLNSRYYDPEIGRFINADVPEILLEDSESLLQYNLYAYCWNDPINMADYTGESPANIIGAIIGGVGGATLGYLLAKELGLSGWKKTALIAAATIGGMALGAFLGPHVAKRNCKRDVKIYYEAGGLAIERGTMEITYFSIFQNDEDGICISFPDIPYCLSCASDECEALKMAKESLELALHGMLLVALPRSSPEELIELSQNQTMIKITVNLEVKNGKLFSPDVIDVLESEKEMRG